MRMTNTMTLFGAYGREYRSTEAIKNDWDAGKDFRIYPAGAYCSNRDIALMKSEGYTDIRIFGEKGTSLSFTL